MENTYTLIIHGWSDCTASFVEMKKRLEERGIGNVESILYADYQSREDNITFNDVIDGLNRQMIDLGLIRPDGTSKFELNVIVHSTGGLVIRHWVWRYYNDRIEDCPVKRIVMLAPANFGSPLAHRGKSFLGRLVKGRWKVGDFLEVGRRLLNGLELASPYQWELAHRDLFYPQKTFYQRDRIQLTILTGIEDYAGIRGWVNKPGTDGTVVIAGSSMDSVKLNLDFSDSDAPYRWQKTKTANDYAFGVLEGLDHGTITSEFEKGEGEIIDLTTEALSISSQEQFSEFRSKIKEITDVTYSKNAGRSHNKYSRYQQFIIRAVDDHDIGIRDYTIEFYIYKSAKEEERLIGKERYFNQTEQMLSEEFHRVFTREFHTHSKDSSYRRLLVNMADMNELIEKAKMQLGPFVLSMKIFVPGIDRGIYYDLDSLQNVVIYHSDNKDLGTPMFFYGNTTTLVELKVKRQTSYVKISKEGKG